MPALGLLLLMIAALIVRQLGTGRALNIPEDFRDAFTGVVSGDLSSVTEVAGRRGSLFGDVTETSAGGMAWADSEPLNSPQGGDPNLIAAQSQAGRNSLVAAANALAVKAGNRYVLGSEGGKDGSEPYDCSGLVWRSLRTTGVYKGPRFTTASFGSVAPKFAKRVTDPRPGDIVIWPSRHMGIVSGNDQMFNALNHKKGIVYTKVSTISKEFGTSPQYWRVGA